MTVDFPKAPPVQRLRAAIDDELRNRATPAQIAELKRPENLVTWLRTLNVLEHQVESHIAKSRKGIAWMRPADGEKASTAYLAAKRRIDTDNVGRLHFLEKVRTRRAEVALLVSDAGLTPNTLGTVIDALITLEGILDDRDLDGAHDFLSLLLDRYEADAASS